MDFHSTAYNFLSVSGINLSKNYLRERLESHPEYPALNALTDILDEFKVENQAIQVVQKERWQELGFPFLAHTVSAEGVADFDVIRNRKTIKSTEEFLKKWTGIALVLGEQKKIIHQEHNNQFSKERRRRIACWSLLTLIALFFVVNQIIVFRPVLFVYFLFSIAGLIISCIIIAYGMGLKTDVSELFCKVEEAGCNTILNSKLGRFAGDIGLGDLAVIFFGGLLIHVSFSLHLDLTENLYLLFIIQTIAFLFTPISILYQLRLKSWCKLCLIIIGIIWIQEANLIWHFFVREPYSLKTVAISFEAYLILGTSISLASFWIMVKPLKIMEQSMLYQKIRIRKWRQDPVWFDALLPLHKRIEDSEWEKEICYGNPSGILQIIIVSDPYCDYCAKAHQQLDEILENHEKDIGVRIRFTAKSFDPQNRSHKAIFEIFKIYEEHVWQKQLENNSALVRSIINDWYTYQDVPVLNEKYGTTHRNENTINALIIKSIQWSQAMQISQTPAFFINGFEMPNPHTFKDLFLFISDYIEILKEKRTRQDS